MRPVLAVATTVMRSVPPVALQAANLALPATALVQPMNGTAQIVPRALRAPADGSSVMRSSPLGPTARPKAKENFSAVVGWLMVSHGRTAPMVPGPVATTTLSPTLPGRVPPLRKLPAVGPTTQPMPRLLLKPLASQCTTPLRSIVIPEAGLFQAPSANFTYTSWLAS